MFLEEERFLEGLWAHGMFRAEDIAGKECLIIGGMYFWEKNYSVTLNERLMDMGAARCDNMVLFSYLVLESFCDLTDVEEAIGAVHYDYIFVLNGMEKTRRICEGVRQVQEICRPGGKIFVAARTPKELSALYSIESYEDVWRYDVDDLCALFGSCALEAKASDDGLFIGALFTRGAQTASSSVDSLFYVRSGTRITMGDAEQQGVFCNASDLDAIGIKYRVGKSSMDHNYLVNYERFLASLRTQPVRLLELGVFFGASMRMWEEYFPRAEIYAVDIEPECGKFATQRAHVIQADLSNREEVSRLREIRPQIIIDDASHIVSHQLLALFTLFDVLPSGGIYILEDLETSLHPEQYSDIYRDCPLDAYEVCSRIARIAARKVPDDDSIYADDINRIGMAAELVSIMTGSVVFIRR